MRSTRFIAFAIWTTLTLLTTAGFAVFSADPEPPPPSPTLDVRAGTGAGAGRLAALGFVRSAQPAPAVIPPSTTRVDATTTTTAPAVVAAEPEPTTTTTAPAPTTTEHVHPTTTTTTQPPPPTTTTAPAEPSTTTTVAEPPPASTGPLSEDEARAIIALYFLAEDVEQALRVADCESNLDPAATNPVSGAAGLFQHIPLYWETRSANAGWSGADIYDANANTAVAAWLVYENGGWYHWAGSEYCWG